MTDRERIRDGFEQRLSAVERLLPQRPTWKVSDEAQPGLRVVTGPAYRDTGSNRGRGWLLGGAFAVLLLVAALVALRFIFPMAAGPGSVASPTGSPNEAPSPSVTPSTRSFGVLMPAVEPHLLVPVEPEQWTVVTDQGDVLAMIHLLPAVGAGGFNVGASIYRPQGVYDPNDETRLLPLPSDLIGWIQQHPDLDADEPLALEVAGRDATAIDATVTYESGGRKGQTAQFINIGPGSWNLEMPSKKRIVLLDLPTGPLLIVYDARPELFDQGIAEFERLLGRIAFEQPSSSP